MAPMIRVARLFMKTPAHGALTPVYLASAPEAEGSGVGREAGPVHAQPACSLARSECCPRGQPGPLALCQWESRPDYVVGSPR